MSNVEYDLPVNYSELNREEKKTVREIYVKEQHNRCYYCKGSLSSPLETNLRETHPISPKLYPKGFFDNPIHLHHNHDTDLTLGAVHAYCNAILWEYHGE